MTSNPFNTFAGGASTPGYKLVQVTPDADNDLPSGVCRALLVGTAGSCNLIDASGASCTGVPLQQGWNPCGVQRVLPGGTASNIWAVY